jgi:hypothetical protein
MPYALFLAVDLSAASVALCLMPYALFLAVDLSAASVASTFRAAPAQQTLHVRASIGTLKGLFRCAFKGPASPFSLLLHNKLHVRASLGTLTGRL